MSSKGSIHAKISLLRLGSAEPPGHLGKIRSLRKILKNLTLRYQQEITDENRAVEDI